MHTLGNLTLTAYNSDFSDRPFAEKRDMPDSSEKGLKQSPLKLNQGLGILEAWNEDTIKARAVKLAGIAVSVWSAPALSPRYSEWLPSETRCRYGIHHRRSPAPSLTQYEAAL